MSCIPSLLLCVSVIAADGGEPEYTPEERSHWAFQTPQRVPVPWPQGPAAQQPIDSPIDAFIYQKLRAQELEPAPSADPLALIRRITFDLTGLPPTPAEIQAFLSKERPRAVRELVDRLLASPRYGEQWGQHWLDVVRFAESEGFEYDRAVEGVWRFRDYVVDSLNADKPFDRFVVEQLAGDELDPDNLEMLTAAGFHRLGPVRRNAGNAEVSFSRNEVLTERTNIIGAAFLGLTMGCARCHDHMFDPIRQADYYRLQAFLAGSYEHNVPLADKATLAAHRQVVEPIEKRVAEIKKELAKTIPADLEEQLRAELKQLDKKLPPPLPVVATVREDEAARTPIFLLERGDMQLPQEQVAPRVPGVLLPEGAPSWSPDVADRKTKLARWIASEQNPLTARVLANRIWHYHFGQGLVSTPNDFGANGDSPTHPELLDYLAQELIAQNWSIKALHRLILNSRTYQQAHTSSYRKVAAEVDPDNRLLWHFPRRRLAAHEIRDAMLAAAGELDSEMGGPSVMVSVEPDLIDLLYKPTQWVESPRAQDHHRRSVYLIAKRNLRLPFMEVFDQPDLQTSCPSRESSTHAPQALELLNGELSNRLAGALAERIQREAGVSPGEQVRRGFVLVTGRSPSSAELKRGIRFLEEYPLSEFALALFNLNAFLYVD